MNDPSATSPDAQESFFGLGPEQVLEAVEAAGLACKSICYPLNSFENRVYEVELADGHRVVVKFYRPGRWNADQIREEHQLLDELAAEEIPVAAVRPVPDGETLKRIGRIYYSVWDRRGGRAPDELSPSWAERLGMLIGRIHAVAAGGRFEHRPALSTERYVREPAAWLQRHRLLPRAYEKRYLDTAEAIADIAEARMLGVETQRIHADLHLGNVLFRDQELRILDFDDSAIGPPVQDLWLALPGRDDYAAGLREQLLRGYERFRIFDRSTLGLVEPLRGLRLVRYAGWLARRWDDPAFKAGWPHFGTDEYWLLETEDLEKQLAVIRADSPSPSPISESLGTAALEPEQELTNKDFFWDWEGD
ncbi:MAG: serine/threonine protein kinase [Acidobacteriota bacterium]